MAESPAREPAAALTPSVVESIAEAVGPEAVS